MLIAILIGSAVVPVGLSVLGLDGVLWAVGLGIPVLCLFALPWLRRMDGEALERRAMLAPRVAVLNACDLFESVREGSVEQLAGSSEFVDVTAEQVVITQGDPADAFYVIVAGEYAVSAQGPAGETLQLQDMGEGDSFGEIGLFEAIPRTATVTARTDGRLLRVDGAAFIDSLTQDAPSPTLIDGAARRLSRTHPTLSLTSAALRSDDGQT